MILARLRTSAPSLSLASVMLLTIVTAPVASLTESIARHSRRLGEEDGEIVQNILWVAGFAVIATAVVAIIRTFVISEANNLPTSGG